MIFGYLTANRGENREYEQHNRGYGAGLEIHCRNTPDSSQETYGIVIRREFRRMGDYHRFMRSIPKSEATDDWRSDVRSAAGPELDELVVVLVGCAHSAALEGQPDRE